MDVYSPKLVNDNLIKVVVDKLKETFGDDIASPIHEPVRFSAQVKLAKTILERNVPNTSIEVVNNDPE
ncbi:hypothetical protein UFOVP49_161 [uncultured Caudovirales phage]|uniref:Uncharacterized protein n=1 Tax=uncultured Caudovirales phage TaxID=2100421 RepID=A0A6J5KTJ8_9CAUD|nr:hypothetical protein UFOVP49_161 [uncultured Caudovirales phage]